MLPVLFTIGPFNVYAFGFFLALSFLLSTFVVWKFAREEGKETEYFDAFLYTNIMGLVSARIFYIVFHPRDFGLNILRFLVVREAPGLSLIGGCIGAFIYLFFYARYKKYNFIHLVDLFSLAFSFSLIFQKIGEQLGGAGYGKETLSALGVKIVGQTGRHHPVEAYESILLSIVTMILIVIFKKTSRRDLPQGVTAILFLGLMSLITFGLEFLKVERVYFNYFTVRQWVSIVTFVLSIILFVIKIRVINQEKKK